MVIDGGLTPFKFDFQYKTAAAISKSKSHSHYQHPSLPLSKLKLFSQTYACYVRHLTFDICNVESHMPPACGLISTAK